MAYSKDSRLYTVTNVKQGMIWDEAVRIFQISRQTLLQMTEEGRSERRLSSVTSVKK